MNRPLLLDGITIQLAGELLFDLGGSDKDRARSNELYKAAFWDFAYAVLFGDTLGRVGSLGERNGVFPGERVVAHDAKRLFIHVLPAAAGSPEDTLADPVTRSEIAADLVLLSTAFSPSKDHARYWSSYIKLEADTFLSDTPVPSENRRPGKCYLFPRRREIYLSDLELQEQIKPDFVSALVSVLQRQHPARLPHDLIEFVQRVLLTHYAISRWYENSAPAANFNRLPFVTRSEIQYWAIRQGLASENKLDERTRLEAIRVRVATDALTDVFTRYRSPKRWEVYDHLVETRGRYVSHRECLARIDFNMQPKNYDPKEIDKALHDLDKLNERKQTQSTIKNVRGKMHSILPESRSLPYPESAYHIFPEFMPMTENRSYSIIVGGNIVNTGGSIQVGDGNISAIRRDTSRSGLLAEEISQVIAFARGLNKSASAEDLEQAEKAKAFAEKGDEASAAKALIAAGKWAGDLAKDLSLKLIIELMKAHGYSFQ